MRPYGRRSHIEGVYYFTQLFIMPLCMYHRRVDCLGKLTARLSSETLVPNRRGDDGQGG